MNIQHPSRSRWISFLQGKLAEHHIVELEEHLGKCKECCELLKGLDDDRLAMAIRDAHSDDDLSKRGALTVGWGEGGNRQPEEILPEDKHVFGRFRLIRKLGQGGFGIVWLAVDERLEREVALKVPSSGSLITREQRTRFLREAKATAGLQHSSIVKVFEAGECDGVCFLVSEYCPCNDLQQWLDSNDPSPHLTAWILKRICKAVLHAHERGILHRDLKPSNILLATKTEDEIEDLVSMDFAFNPKVTDFGLAKVLAEGHDETATKTVMGSASYMSPEQANGTKVDSRTDIYSLGIILYQMLAGRLPNEGKSDLEIIRLVGQEPITAPSRFRGGIPSDLETICLKCLAIEPGQRYESASMLCDDLCRFLRGEPIMARPVSSFKKAMLWCRRKPWVASVWSLLSLTTLGALLFSWALWGLHNTANGRLEAKQLAEEKTKLALFDAKLQQVRLGRLGRHDGRRFAGLNAAQSAAEIVDELQLSSDKKMQLRNEVIGCLSLFDLQVESAWSVPRSRIDTTGIAVDHDLDRYAIWTASGDIEIRNMIDNRVLNKIENKNVRVSGREDWHLNLHFSPNSRYLVTDGSPSVFGFRVWDLEDGNRVVLDLPAESLANDLSFCFDPESQWIAINQEKLVRYALPSGNEVGCIENVGSNSLFCPFPSSDQFMLSSVSGLQIISGSGAVERSFVSNCGRPDGIAIHPDSMQVAYSVQNKLVIQSLSADEQSVEMSVEHSGPIISMFYSADGRFLVTSGWDGASCIWDPVRKKLLLKIDRTALSFSRDSKYLAFGLTGDKIGRWRVADGSERKTWQEDGTVSSIGFGLDGRLLILAVGENVSTWDTLTGELISKIRPGVISTCWIAPDNSELWLSGPNGLFRIPAKVSGDEHVLVSLGDSEPITTAGDSCYRVAATPDGKFLAVSRAGDNESLMVIDAKSGQPVSESLKIPFAHYHSLSPDASLIAVSSWHSYECLVFDVQSGRLLKTFDGQSANPVFSPDGRWLVVGDGSSYQIVSTDDWKVVKTISRNLSGGGAPLVFSQQGSIAAICDGFRTVKLLECDGWNELATLGTHRDGNIRELAISPQGDFLAASHSDSSVTLWNLRKIRSGLTHHSLDWQSPALPARSKNQLAETITIN